MLRWSVCLCCFVNVIKSLSVPLWSTSAGFLLGFSTAVFLFCLCLHSNISTSPRLIMFYHHCVMLSVDLLCCQWKFSSGLYLQLKLKYLLIKLDESKWKRLPKCLFQALFVQCVCVEVRSVVLNPVWVNSTVISLMLSCSGNSHFDASRNSHYNCRVVLGY